MWLAIRCTKLLKAKRHVRLGREGTEMGPTKMVDQRNYLAISGQLSTGTACISEEWTKPFTQNVAGLQELFSGPCSGCRIKLNSDEIQSISRSCRSHCMYPLESRCHLESFQMCDIRFGNTPHPLGNRSVCMLLPAGSSNDCS